MGKELARTYVTVCPQLCRFSNAGNHDAHHALRRPAFEKRQGTKSRREVVRWQCRGGAVPEKGYGDLVGWELKIRRLAWAIRVEQRCNLKVPARILLNGDFTFCPIYDFKGLRLAREHTSTTSAR